MRRRKVSIRKLNCGHGILLGGTGALRLLAGKDGALLAWAVKGGETHIDDSDLGHCDDG